MCYKFGSVIFIFLDTEETQSAVVSQPEVLGRACKRLRTTLDEFEDDDLGPALPVDELTTYLTLRVPSEPMTDLLHWWKLNEPALPKLANVAKRLLCVPASSSSSERVFSAAGSTVSQRRTALDPES